MSAEQQVVVVFDVSAPTRHQAASVIARALGRNAVQALRDACETTDTALESWWFPEADLKAIDGNDNAAMHLEHDDPDDGPAATALPPYPNCGRCKGTGTLGGWQGPCPQCQGVRKPVRA